MVPCCLGLGFFCAPIPTTMAYLCCYRGLRQIREGRKGHGLASMKTVAAEVMDVMALEEKWNFVHVPGIAAVMVFIVTDANVYTAKRSLCAKFIIRFTK